MKIVFLCGSLEPGRDGVGDYTRRLAVELMQQGHQVSAIALNDFHITEVFTGEQSLETNRLPVLRIPAVWSPKKRLGYTKEWIKEMNAEWISFQFVPFAFHSKGLPFGLGRLTTELGKGRLWHIMFHELWVGMDREATKKHMLWGWLQRWLIRNLIADLNPRVIHTHTRYYQVQLAELGVDAKHLPLFSNIPKCCTNKGISLQQGFIKPEKTISFVHFGSIHHGAPIALFAAEAALYEKKKGVQIVLKLIGRCGTEQEHWAIEWRAAGLQVELLGEQSPFRISEILSKAFIGISTTPIVLAEKSGAVAAMWEHGLRVLCISRPWDPRHITDLELPSGIIKYRRGNLEAFLDEKNNIPFACKISDVSRQFAYNLLATV